MEDEKSLKPRALVSQLPDSVQDQVHDLLADGVVASGVVVGGVLLAGDQLLGVEELAVGTSPHLVWTKIFVNFRLEVLENIELS